MASKKKKLLQKRERDLEKRCRRPPSPREIPKAPTSALDMLDEFRKFGLAEASGMVAGKDSDYGHWSEYPDVVLASLMFTGAKRAVELTRKDDEAVNKSLEDTCLDLINCASFLYGKLKSRSVR